MRRRRLIAGAAAVFAAAFLLGGGTADASGDPPGCIPRSGGFVLHLCLSTPPPLGGDDRRAEPREPSPGLLLEVVRTSGAELHVEASLGAADRAAISAALARDVPAIEREYGRLFERRPVIDVFATEASFERAVQLLFGYPASVARSLAGGGGAMDRPSGAIVINWQRVSSARPIVILRHELSHLMVRQIAGLDASLPAWFDEGLATLQQHAVGPQAVATTDDYLATALLSTRSLSLAQLVTAESWLRSAAAGPGAYSVAGSVAGTLREQVGQAGIVRILELTASGRTFEEAFAAVASRSVASFGADAVTRGAERSPPEIGVAPLPDARGDLAFVIRGFPPAGPIEVSIDGVGLAGDPYRLEYDVRADAVGMYRGSFGSTAPAGTYAIRARSGTVGATAVLRTWR